MERQETQVLAYHQIDGRADLSWNRVPPERFARQMELLAARGWGVVSLRERAEEGRDRRLALTFDDALAGVVENALPVLRRLGFRATLFVPTAWIGRENRWDTRLAGRRARHASASALRRAADEGWEIGAHGHTHRDLTRLPDEALAEELRECRRAVAGAVGSLPESIAYPFGSVDRRVIEAVRGAGFTRGCLSVSRPGTRDAFRIGRMGVRRFDGDAEFLAKVEGGFLYPWQVAKDRIAQFCSLGTPRVRQRIRRGETAC
ncbi:MAG: polysaccharide deacetylase family protein [Candidatus Eisenbacteria bacterium]